MVNNPQRYPHSHRRAMDTAAFTALFACSFPGSLVTVPGHHLGAPGGRPCC